MTRHLPFAIAGAVLLAGADAGAAGAQGYHLRVEARAQSVSYRGVSLDSIPASDTVSTPGRGPSSPDGFAVRCAPEASYCTFFRPGPERTSQPFTTTASLSMWGLGLAGLSVHGMGRLGLDLGGDEFWPGTEPAVQLLEGYAQYTRGRGSVRLGRQVEWSRLGSTGFDGARAGFRDPARGLEVDGYLGWSLARGVALPVSSPALNPLDDFQPRGRFVVAGGGAGWRSDRFDVRADYQREVNPRTDHFVSERFGVQLAARPVAGVELTGGADYDLAAGWWGSAEASLEYAHRVGRASIGVRRYQPHFDLWTIWGAFSPVPYRAVEGALTVRPHRRLVLRTRYERYKFDDTEAETPLFDAERDGWRWDLGGTLFPAERWTLDVGYRAEHGPGAAAEGLSGSLAYRPSRRLAVALLASTVSRPLEFRFNEAVVRRYGIDADFTASSRLRLGVTASRYEEEHKRPDAGAFDWDQFRVAARVVVQLGSGADLGGLPPAIRLLPGGRAER